MQGLYIVSVLVALVVDVSSQDCPPNTTVVMCESNPCDVESCMYYPKAHCQSNYCGGCNAEYFANGQKIDCTDPDIAAFCPKSEVAPYDCGLGFGTCPDDYWCHVHATDAWAVCCPNDPGCTEGDGTWHQNGTNWSTGECSWCECNDGGLSCSILTCVPPSCNDATNVPGVCCPVCGCTYNGMDYDYGARFPATDGCNTCTCDSAGVGCTEIGCLGCPPEKPEVMCPANPCDGARCDLYPAAYCQPNYCGECSAEYFVDGQKIDCNAQVGCPPEMPEVMCPANPCDGARCDLYPAAYCQPNYCGECSAEYFDDGQKIDCNVQVEECGACDAMYDPVCAQDETTYSSECVMQLTDCQKRTPEAYENVVVYPGECDGRCTDFNLVQQLQMQCLASFRDIDNGDVVIPMQTCMDMVSSAVPCMESVFNQCDQTDMVRRRLLTASLVEDALRYRCENLQEYKSAAQCLRRIDPGMCVMDAALDAKRNYENFAERTCRMQSGAIQCIADVAQSCQGFDIYFEYMDKQMCDFDAATAGAGTLAASIALIWCAIIQLL